HRSSQSPSEEESFPKTQEQPVTLGRKGPKSNQSPLEEEDPGAASHPQRMSPSHFLRPRSSQSPSEEEDPGAASHPRMELENVILSECTYREKGEPYLTYLLADCSLKNREPDVLALSWFLDPGGWSKTVGLYFIFLESVPCPLGGLNSLGLNSSTIVDTRLFSNIVTYPDGSPLHFCNISCTGKVVHVLRQIVEEITTNASDHQSESANFPYGAFSKCSCCQFLSLCKLSENSS
ncbi:hypothetical protein STEG23_010878, partial [Scotinomys teguina]